MEIINTTNLLEARKQIDSSASKKEKVVVISQDDAFNGKILENKKVDAIIINEQIEVKDYMKQRDSSLNEPYCKLAKKNEISIAIDVDAIAKKNDIEKARSLARLKQNIMLCKKNKNNLIFFSKKPKQELQSLMLVLGADTSQAKKATEVSFFK